MRKFCIFLIVASMFLLVGRVQAEDAKVVISKGRLVAFNYTLTVDGQVVDSSKGKAPLQYTQGQSQIVLGLEKQLEGLRMGDKKSVTVTPQEGYGMVDPKAFQEVALSALPKNIEPKVGLMLESRDPNSGQIIRMRIAEIKKDSVVFDFNHPLAGKTLNFDIEIVSIK
jgi:FKBP-type peptidyl-prolyl cis-trans isomerase 2